MGQLLSPRREQPLFRVSQPLPVVARDPLAAQEVPAADLETDQATVLGAPLDQPRRHEASLARRGLRDPIPLPRSQHPLPWADTGTGRATTRPGGGTRSFGPLPVRVEWVEELTVGGLPDGSLAARRARRAA